MNEDEAEIFCRFAELIRLASADVAIGKGTTYDLCYCNYSSDGFDKNRHFAFLRDYEEHTLLIVANFSQIEANMKIMIPEHAFEWMGIPVSPDLYPGKTFEITIPPMDGRVISLF